MPYTVPSGSIVEMRLRMASQGQSVMNTFHWQYTDATQIPDGAAALQDLFDRLNQPGVSLRGTYEPAVSTAIGFQAMELQWIKTTRYVARSFDISAWVGSGGMTELPASVAGVIQFKSDLGGRAFRGRWYMPSVPSNFFSGMDILGAGQNAYNALGAQLATEVVTAATRHYQPVIYHRLNPLNPTNITVGQAAPHLQTQRRRLSGHGI